ncbi:hypothetical protein H5410_061647 [Solanum commersonii]|uniref:Uncharacterized protein n=1 Tax=Solanum commersonii TaxID=4109 RepID=A0A9J5W8K6_SOLCO|nr:hypothetical protein H5410_061647 [Solanum commersonii]
MAQESLVLRGTMKAHTDWVTAIATPINNSDMIVTSSRDKSIIVWSLTRAVTRWSSRRLTSHGHFVQDVVLGMESFAFGFFKENGLPKMVLVDLVYHYGGEWIREPKLLYERKLVHKWEGYDSVLSYIDIINECINILGYMGVQKLIVFVPSGKYYEIEGDEGFRTLLSFVNDKFDVINLFVAEDSELDVDTVAVIDDVATDCTSDGTENDSDASTDNSNYNSEELEVLAQERKRVIDGSLCDYKDLHRSMTFKDIAKARKYISLHSLANGYNLTIKKVTKRFRVVCEEKCNFVCLVSGEKHSAGVSVKTLKGEHKCDDTCGNYKANPKYKIKEMRVDLKTAFNINAHFEKCKRAKRMILEDIEDNFCDDYKKLVGYANALKEPDVVLKNGFKNGLRPFIGLEDSMNHFYPIACAIVDRECKVSWVWFLEFLQKSLNINSEEGITFMSDMQKTWCGVFFDTVCKNNKVENNLAESFNSWILEARHKQIIGMLEDIRIKVMTKFIANMCELNFNGDDGFEVSEGNDRHIVNLATKKCTCKYSKEAYLLAYHCKLQSVPGQKFWKIEVEQAMEPPELVNLVGRPRMNRKSDKDEALKRQTGWVASRRGEKMTCSNCEILGHNTRGCHKFNHTSKEDISNTRQVKSKKKKMDKQCKKGKKQTNGRHRTLIDEEDVEFNPPSSPIATTVEDFPLTAPQPTQDCALDEDEDFALDVEGDMPWKPRDFSELSVPSDLYAPKELTWKGNASITGRMLEQSGVEKLKTKKGNGKAQQ